MKNAVKVLCFVLAVIIAGSAGFYFYLSWDKSDFTFADGVDKDTVAITGYVGNSVNIVIPDRLRGKKVVSIERNAFRGTAIESILLNRYIKNVGNGAFEDCEKLKSADLGSVVKSLSETAFYNCPSLESVKISPSLERIGPAAFGACPKLKNIDFSGNSFFVLEDGIIYNAGKTKIIQALSCTDLSSVNIPDSVTEFEDYAFSNHTELKSFKVPVNVTRISSGAFAACSSLTELVLHDGVSSIGAAALSGTALKSLVIPSGVSIIDKSAFYGLEKTLVLKGTKGSYAEKFAGENGFKFTAV